MGRETVWQKRGKTELGKVAKAIIQLSSLLDIFFLNFFWQIYVFCDLINCQIILEFVNFFSKFQLFTDISGRHCKSAKLPWNHNVNYLISWGQLSIVDWLSVDRKKSGSIENLKKKTMRKVWYRSARAAFQKSGSIGQQNASPPLFKHPWFNHQLFQMIILHLPSWKMLRSQCWFPLEAWGRHEREMVVP